jgi:hypothetical protein
MKMIIFLPLLIYQFVIYTEAVLIKNSRINIYIETPISVSKMRSYLRLSFGVRYLTLPVIQS